MSTFIFGFVILKVLVVGGLRKHEEPVNVVELISAVGRYKKNSERIDLHSVFGVSRGVEIAEEMCRLM